MNSEENHLPFGECRWHVFFHVKFQYGRATNISRVFLGLMGLTVKVIKMETGSKVNTQLIGERGRSYVEDFKVLDVAENE